jgi:hypothetical protein
MLDWIKVFGLSIIFYYFWRDNKKIIINRDTKESYAHGWIHGILFMLIVNSLIQIFK